MAFIDTDLEDLTKVFNFYKTFRKQIEVLKNVTINSYTEFVENVQNIIHEDFDEKRTSYDELISLMRRFEEIYEEVEKNYKNLLEKDSSGSLALLYQLLEEYKNTRLYD